MILSFYDFIYLAKFSSKSLPFEMSCGVQGNCIGLPDCSAAAARCLKWQPMPI